ncbi:hypothetical protein IG631_07915 [Alternaria alternata]|nr:hypothetical protein IG631_07915 [Alternaria alternata]
MLLDRLLFRLPILAAKHPANPAFCAQQSSAGTSSQRCARMADCRLMLFSGRRECITAATTGGFPEEVRNIADLVAHRNAKGCIGCKFAVLLVFESCSRRWQAESLLSSASHLDRMAEREGGSSSRTLTYLRSLHIPCLCESPPGH